MPAIRDRRDQVRGYHRSKFVVETLIDEHIYRFRRVISFPLLCSTRCPWLEFLVTFSLQIFKSGDGRLWSLLYFLLLTVYSNLMWRIKL